jgi:hypothetical protein
MVDTHVIGDAGLIVIANEEKRYIIIFIMLDLLLRLRRRLIRLHRRKRGEEFQNFSNFLPPIIVGVRGDGGNGDDYNISESKSFFPSALYPLLHLILYHTSFFLFS